MEHSDEIVEAMVRPTVTNSSDPNQEKSKKWKQQLIAHLPFTSILDNYDQVTIAAKISEIRELRNRVMHGRYLTKSNADLIYTICEQYNRFIVEPGHVGKFENRTLAS